MECWALPTSDSVGKGCDHRICFSDNFPGNIDAAIVETTFWEPLLWQLFCKHNAILEKLILSDYKSNGTNMRIFSFLPGMATIGSKAFSVFSIFFPLKPVWNDSENYSFSIKENSPTMRSNTVGIHESSSVLISLIGQILTHVIFVLCATILLLGNLAPPGIKSVL